MCSAPQARIGADGAHAEGIPGTFDVLGQSFPGAGVLDAVSAPRRVELDQPGRGGVADGRLEAAAAQDHQRVLLRVQPRSGTQSPVEEAEQHRGLEPESPGHPERLEGRSESWRGSAAQRHRHRDGHESSCRADDLFSG